MRFRRRFSDLQKQQIVEEYINEKISTYTLARRWNCSQGLVYRIVNKYAKTRIKKEAMNTNSCRNLLKQNNSTVRGEMRSKKNPNYKNGEYKDKNGYIILTGMQNHPFAIGRRGQILKHRFEVEQYLKKYYPESPALIEVNKEKYLNPIINTHHKDSNPSNNQIKNLFIFENNSEHIRYHDFLRYKNPHKAAKVAMQNLEYMYPIEIYSV